MGLYYSTKHGLKVVRWQARRAATALRWGPGAAHQTPAVVGNAMPKSGSHLIIQVLQGLTRLGPFVNPGFPPLNRTEDNRKLDDTAILANIRRLRSGDIAYGYLQASEPYVAALTALGLASVFVYRDPRDMIISHIFYATEIHEEHWMHEYYTQTLHTMEERIDAAIRGVEEPGAELTPIRERYARYQGWLAQPAVLCLRFEDLILDQAAAFGRLLDYLAGRHFTPKAPRPQAIAVLQEAVAPRRSGTFRKAKPGNWREHFTEANKTLFKQQAGDLLIELGYETSEDW
jgi:hypothetical protein